MRAVARLRPISKIAAERDQTLEVYSRTGCSGFPPADPTPSENARLCAEWSSQTLASVAADSEVSTVIVSVRTMLTRGDPEVAAAQLRMLKDSGKHVYVFRVVPGMPDEWPVDFSDRAQFAPDCVERGGDCDWTPADWDDWLVDAAETAGVEVIDSWEVICPDGVCKAVIGGTIVYFDESHLTRTFAETLTPWLRNELSN